MQKTLVSGGVLGIQAIDSGVLHGTRMNDDAIAIAHALARRDGHGSVLRFIVREDGQAPRVSSEETIGACVPSDRMARIFGMIEDCDADLFAVDLSGIVAPRRWFAPELLLPD